ncbi:cephalosporin hydroxylase family protein [uncultured Sneathiella sp.]|uniref:cephalosporin hydroxylase family protein n=1 Tax=uncultured Sneathiella sp. TaxID=879315 RepID=UPI0030EE9588|tara:strand:+ start:26477 stop:27304 length:828 start_codon:yes stop_codon:yes gene_type:complete
MQSKSADAIAQFQEEVAQTVKSYGQETAWKNLSHEWLTEALAKRYVYNFSSLGRPIIQLPTDMVAFQEIVWDVKPDLIIETGIAHGGSLIQSAAMLAMLDYCDAVEAGTVLDPKSPKRRVLGVDIDIRAHNRAAIEAHPMSSRIDMIQGSSIDPKIVDQVKAAAASSSRILVSLDSNHTHDHVLAELEAYAPLTSKGSYCLVFDTIVEDMAEDFYPDRPWHPGNSPKSAVFEYLKKLEGGEVFAVDGDPLHFENDQMLQDKLMFSVTPDGFLKRV